jgi:hypothetical protein
VSDLLAVDPGLDSPGAALFRGGVLLDAADIVVPDLGAGVSHGQRALAAANAVISWVLCHNVRISVVAHEWPQIYAASKSKANPNNLIGMAAVDGAVDCAFAIIAAQRGEQLEVRTFLPAEWAGQLPKDTRKGMYWKSARGTRIKSRLIDTEWQIARVLDHDGGDAVGIGCHALGRLGVRRALATGR